MYSQIKSPPQTEVPSMGSSHFWRSDKSEMTYANLTMYDTCHWLKSGAAFINWLPPLFVLLLVGYSYYVYVVTFCINYVKSGSKFYAYLVVYHILVIFFVWTFCETMFTLHQAIPEDYTLNQEEHDKLLSYNDNQIDMILKKLAQLRQIDLMTLSDYGRIRYCKHCKLIKPDRTHHCSSCERCIMKMDHHCPWINNCVGYSNYKQFVLLLMYASLMCIFYMASMGQHVAQFMTEFLSDWRHIHLSMGFVFAAVSAILVVILLGYHLNLIRKNETTLESMHDITYVDDSYTFDLGCSRNFVQIFGPNPLLWFLPVRSAEGTGCEYPVKHLA